MRAMKILALLLAAAPALAGQELLLVLDAPAGASDHLSRFRRFDDLRISGSSEFSVPGLRALRARLPVSRFTVVDLREESHGFAGGLPVSWEANHNWANVGRTPDEVRADEARRLAALSQAKQVSATRLDAKYQRTDAQRVSLSPGRALSEQELVTGAGLDYLRFTVTDHTHPNDSDVDRFVTEALPRLRTGWMHFHCKAGVGRTTTFMAMADMLKNALREPAAAIIQRQGQAARYDLERIHHGWAGETSRERRDFLYAFHAYCRAAAPSFSLTWSEWARARRASAKASTSGQTPATSAR